MAEPPRKFCNQEGSYHLWINFVVEVPQAPLFTLLGLQHQVGCVQDSNSLSHNSKMVPRLQLHSNLSNRNLIEPLWFV
jgi:hypothetical protein